MGANTLSAAVAFTGMLLVCRGYMPLIKLGKTDAGGRMVRGAALFGLFAVLRFGYWDLTRSYLKTTGGWQEVYQALGGANINLLPNLIAIWAAYELLQARYLLIPENDREGWNFISAPFYPYRNCLVVRISRGRK